MTTDLIKELLRQLPQKPGVYIMKDVKGNILYVGKAVNLRNRVRSYFTSPSKLMPKTRMMVSEVHEFEYFVVSSEQEALILELNLVKHYWPPYNVLLKDDKTFPYLKIKKSESWPRLHITRKLEEDGGIYFGPFSSIHSLRRSMDVLKRLFPLRSCNLDLDRARKKRPCLKFDMGYCLAPCTGGVSAGEYNKIIDGVIDFLNGKHEYVVRSLKKDMAKASSELDFERAARLRDQVQSIEHVIEGQNIAMKVKGEQDAVAFAAAGENACVQVFMIRYGKLIGRESFTLKGVRDESPVQIMTSFIEQFYSSSTYIPKLILVQHPVENEEVIEKWLSQKKDGAVEIEAPVRGRKKQLVDIAAENARQGLEQLKIKQLSAPEIISDALADLQKELNLSILPERIEGYDISNIQGRDAVGSMVVFENGRPASKNYRRFKIKTVEGANDFAMMKEMLKRRFKHAGDNDEEPDSSSWAALPDLILIDGGKGQVSAAYQVMRELGVENIPMIGLAKENEEIFPPGRSVPIVLPRTSSALKLLQRVRDEAHRFAVTYHKNVRKKRSFTSALDSVSGIGPKKKKALIKQFGSVQNMRDASIGELTGVPGINESLAARLKEVLAAEN